MHIRKILSLFICSVMLCSCLFISSFAAAPTVIDSGSCGPKATWTLDSSGLLTICGSGTMDPHNSADHTPWHNANVPIRQVVVEEGITGIANYSFQNQTDLASITLPSSLRAIEDYAFFGCSSLKSIQIPRDVSYIGGKAFGGCTNLTGIGVSGRVPGLDSPDYSSGLRPAAAAESAFNAASAALESAEDAYMKAKLEGNAADVEAADRAFSQARASYNTACQNMPSYAGIFYDSPISTVTVFGSEVIAPNAFAGMRSLQEVFIGDPVTKILNYAFANCVNLQYITIPSKVELIAENAFSGCSKFTEVTIRGNAAEIQAHAFPSDVTIRCHTGSTAQTYAQNWGYAYVLIDAPSDPVPGTQAGVFQKIIEFFRKLINMFRNMFGSK